MAQKAIVYLSIVNVGLQASAVLQDLRREPVEAPEAAAALMAAAQME